MFTSSTASRLETDLWKDTNGGENVKAVEGI